MSVPEQERLARVALNRLAEPGDPRLTSLVADLGAVAVRDHLLGERDLDSIASDVAARLAALDPEGDLERAQRLGIRFLVPGDEEWPTGLDDLGSAGVVNERGGTPIGLWVRGEARLDEVGPAVAVVGSRSSSSYGDWVAGEIAAVTARAGYCVVSGGAVGIDRAAHRGALGVRGHTIAVLACGADRVYPRQNKQLLDHVAEVGAVVSEAPLGGAPMRVRFLARNRLIAAMTRGTVVAEAAVRSGALSTAGWAERLSRPVMGVPGAVTSAESEGVHARIRSGAAVLVTHGDDVLELLGRPGEHLVEEPRGPSRKRDRLTVREQQVLDAVPVGRAARADSIARTAGVGLREVQSALRRLAERGMVEGDGSGWRLTAATRA